jgi:hypothetical protein
MSGCICTKQGGTAEAKLLSLCRDKGFFYFGIRAGYYMTSWEYPLSVAKGLHMIVCKI